MTMQAFKKGDILFREGDHSAEIYKVSSGAVDVIADYGTAKQQLLITKHAGAFLGEFAGLFQDPRSATAIVSEDCTLEVYQAEELLGEDTFNFEFLESVLYLMMDESDEMLRRFVEMDIPSRSRLPEVTEEHRRALAAHPKVYMEQFSRNITESRKLQRRFCESLAVIEGDAYLRKISNSSLK